MFEELMRLHNYNSNQHNFIEFVSLNFAYVSGFLHYFHNYVASKLLQIRCEKCNVSPYYFWRKNEKEIKGILVRLVGYLQLKQVLKSLVVSLEILLDSRRPPS